MPFEEASEADKSNERTLLQFSTDHLLEFIALNLGENYLLGFSKERRLAFARESLDRHDQWRLARDVMAKFAERDFDFFMPEILDLSELTTQVPPTESDLLAITRDYGRMMVMMRQRVVMEDPDAYKAKLEDLESGTEAYKVLERQKHKRLHVIYMHVRMLKMMKEYAERVGYAKLIVACEDAIKRLPKEHVPMPRQVPDYIAIYKLDEAGRPVFVEAIDDDGDQPHKSLDDDVEVPSS